MAKKIGVLGATNSGKTIFLTSLLWHLSDHAPARFKIGKNGTDEITDCSITDDKKHDFNFEKNKNTFTQSHKWPDKTADFSVVHCKYNRKNSPFEKKISFVDIPGERMSDILMWTSASYSEWVENLMNFWSTNPKISSIVAEYNNWAKDGTANIDILDNLYKAALWKMLDVFCPVTPSTYLLDQNGSMLSHVNGNRPIWCGGRLLPVPAIWKQRQPKIYKELEQNFKRYKKEVLKPLFDEIYDCDNFIFCVDIQNILMSGPELLIHFREETKKFREVLAPSKFFRFVNKILNKQPRLAWVATKSDMILPDDKDRFEYLLKDLSRAFRPSGVETECFICSSCVSTQVCRDNKNQVWLQALNDGAGAQAPITTPRLPNGWPNTWNGEDYIFEEIPPRISIVNPPDQYNLDRIFEFIAK